MGRSNGAALTAKIKVIEAAKRVGAYDAIHGALDAALPGRRRTAREAFGRRVRLYRQFVGPYEYALDVGANIGNRVEAFLAIGAEVVAVEPQPWCLEQLRRKFGSDSRVAIVAAGAGAQAGSATLHLSDAHTIASMSSKFIDATGRTGRFGNHQWTGTVEVTVKTLDDLLSWYGLPAFCKIDVEGYELEVLRGLSRPIQTISFEFTPELSEVTEACVRRLEELGEYEFSYSLGETMELEGVWSSGDDLLAKLSALGRPGPAGDVYARLVDHDS